ncbi:dual specificity protein phosphatase CDC14A-like [Condylostylus longicornis]|uniref:dual specificity protein phosphatase CDC14A-like n=1 Tax=Condylostylus longicornis TaxID=2530218 RepID=UPI00244DD2BD|nr:dual specificity protein phosphatase CDC14A-like [Condylostylus longicornis]
MLLPTAGRRFHNLPRGALDAALARGLLVSPVETLAPSLLANAVEVIPDRLYWLTVFDGSRPSAHETHFFNLDSEFVYEPFFADFGPLNLGHTYRYCELLEEKLTDPRLADRRIVHYTTADMHKRSNAAYLMVSFCVVLLGWEPDAAVEMFNSQPPLLPFRDATYGSCSYQLTLFDCARGLDKGIQLGWFDYDSFDITTYEYYERLENGDLNWIIPNKFIAFSGPEEIRVWYGLSHGFVEVSQFLVQGVKLVIRLNKKQYDRRSFTSQGIDHIDLYFLDGSCPSKEIISRFLDIAEREAGAIAVHCKAGLGRTGTLIGCYAIKHFGFTGREWISWNRICRPGSVLGPQQHFLGEMEVRDESDSTNSNFLIMQEDLRRMAHASVKRPQADLASLLQERKTAEQGDFGQGNRLVNSKRLGKVSACSTPPTTAGTPLSLHDDDVPASTPPAHSDEAGSLTPIAHSPIAKLPRRVQPEDVTAKAADDHLLKVCASAAIQNDETILILAKTSLADSSVTDRNTQTIPCRCQKLVLLQREFLFNQNNSTKATQPKQLNQSNSTKTTQPKQLNQNNSTKATTATQPQQLNQSNSTKATQPKQLNQSNSTKATQPKQLNQSNSTKATQPKQLNQSNSTKATQPKQLNQSNSTKATQPKQLNQSNSTKATQPKQLNQSNSTKATQPKQLNQSNSTKATQPKQLNQSDSTKATQPKQLNQSNSTKATQPNSLPCSMRCH